MRCHVIMTAPILAMGFLATMISCGAPEKATTQPTIRTTRATQSSQRPPPSPRQDETFDMTQVPGRVHIVQAEDTLWSLAERYYGNGKHWRKILVANRNRLTNAMDLPVGMKLIIP